MWLCPYGLLSFIGGKTMEIWNICSTWWKEHLHHHHGWTKIPFAANEGWRAKRGVTIVVKDVLNNFKGYRRELCSCISMYVNCTKFTTEDDFAQNKIQHNMHKGKGFSAQGGWEVSA